MTRYALDVREAIAWSVDPETDDFGVDPDIVLVEVPDGIPEETVMEQYERACVEVDAPAWEEGNDPVQDPEAALEAFLALVPGSFRTEGQRPS